jgi:acyl carrier protein
MTDQELLLELTESYLKSLVSEASSSLSPDFSSFAPFGELGVDSFHVLKIIKALEADFGTLPKTLLFENFNINDLARYFVREHTQTLSVRFATDQQVRAAPAHGEKEASVEVVPSQRVAAQVLPVLSPFSYWKKTPTHIPT